MGVEILGWLFDSSEVCQKSRKEYVFFYELKDQSVLNVWEWFPGHVTRFSEEKNFNQENHEKIGFGGFNELFMMSL